MTPLSNIKAKIVEGPCWDWPGHITDKGYARRKKNGKQVNVHRAIFEAVIKDIPKDMVIDHLCRNRKCVNPYHLEVVSIKENVMRGIGISARNYQKTHCKNGHPLSGENVRINSQDARICIICRRAYEQNLRDEKRRNKTT